MERVGHQDSVEVRKWPRLARDISEVGLHAHALVRRGDFSQGRGVAVHGVDRAAGGKAFGERTCERACATSESAQVVGPSETASLPAISSIASLNRMNNYSHRDLAVRAPT